MLLFDSRRFSPSLSSLRHSVTFPRFIYSVHSTPFPSPGTLGPDESGPLYTGSSEKEINRGQLDFALCVSHSHHFPFPSFPSLARAPRHHFFTFSLGLPIDPPCRIPSPSPPLPTLLPPASLPCPYLGLCEYLAACARWAPAPGFPTRGR